MIFLKCMGKEREEAKRKRRKNGEREKRKGIEYRIMGFQYAAIADLKKPFSLELPLRGGDGARLCRW